MHFLEASFPVLGHSVPLDHAYALYGALSVALPLVHEMAFPISIGSITGRPVTDHRLAISSRSRLTLRLPSELFAEVLPLAGRQLKVADSQVGFGIPTATLLAPQSMLFARMVAIRCAADVSDPEYPRHFLESARSIFAKAGIKAGLSLARSSTSPGRCSPPQRRVLRIRGCTIVGYSVVVDCLSESDSISLQANWRNGDSIFGRRKFGCAFFVSGSPRTRERGSHAS